MDNKKNINPLYELLHILESKKTKNIVNMIDLILNNHPNIILEHTNIQNIYENISYETRQYEDDTLIIKHNSPEVNEFGKVIKEGYTIVLLKNFGVIYYHKNYELPQIRKETMIILNDNLNRICEELKDNKIKKIEKGIKY